MKFRKAFAVTCLSVLGTGLITACSLLAIRPGNGEDKPENPDHININEVENIHILSSTKSSDGNTITVKYTLQPSSVNYVNFNTSLTWSEKESDGYESETWHNGKATSDYVSYEIDQNKKTINFQCLAPFGREMIFTLSSPNNDNIKSSLSLDYTRREIEAPKAEVEEEGFVENKALNVNMTMPVYSVGSVGERPTDMFTIEKTYYDYLSNTYDSLFPQPNTQGLYSVSFKYQGKNYTNPELLRMAIRDHVKEYMFTLYGLNDAKTFVLKEFEEAFTYEYAAYSMAGNTVYLKNSSIMNTFLTRYETAYEKGAAFQMTVSYDKRKLLTKKLKISLSSESLSGINFEDTNITF